MPRSLQVPISVPAETDRLGLKIHVVHSQSENLLTVYEQIHPDLVITDLVMPEMHGVLLIEQLKAAHPACKVIAISGKAPEHLQRAIQAGALATLEKPMERRALVEAVERALAPDRFESGPGT